MAPEAISCPQCGSKRIWKDGIRYVRIGKVQRYLCQSCGHRFSDSKIKVDIIKQSLEFSDSMHDFRDLDSVNVGSGKVDFQDPSLTVRKDICSHRFSVTGKTINKFLLNSRERQVCAPKLESKNLAKMEPPKNRLAGATTLDQASVKGKLVEFAWWMKKQGYAETTILTRIKLLKILTKRGADLFNVESVKEAIAHQKWCNKRKVNGADAYTAFLRMTGKTWDPPRYKYAIKLPFIPKEAELDTLISGCGPKTSTFLQLLKETAMRAGEAHGLQWTDIDFESGTVRVTPEKGSRPRIFKLSNTLLKMLLNLKNKAKSNRIFSKHLRTQRRLFQKQRSTLARKLQNPRLLQIHFHTFRHWKATQLYHQTKDILYVMRFLGHRNIKNTLMYVQLEEALFKDANEEFACKAAGTIEKAKVLIEAGFSYVCEINGVQLFRKRK